jgi:hypothetical protein
MSLAQSTEWSCPSTAVLVEAFNERGGQGVPVRQTVTYKPLLGEVRKTTLKQRANHRGFF